MRGDVLGKPYGTLQSRWLGKLVVVLLFCRLLVSWVCFIWPMSHVKLLASVDWPMM